MLKLKQFKTKLDKELEIFFNKRIKEAKSIDPSAKQIMTSLKNFTLGSGKRIRAALIYYGFKCFKNNNEKELLKASMCIELIQSYLLIHDDIIDKDELRRGKPTLHKQYEKNNNPHYGISMAILAGDILSSLATQLLAYTKFKNKLKAIAELNKIIPKVIYGQILDIKSELKLPTEKSIDKIHHLKTATYTVEGPLHIGAILAGANEKYLKQLSRYAIPLGKAFQIQDDILGLFADEKKLGKPIGSDLREGKNTLLIIKALEKANLKQKLTIKKALGNSNLTKSQIDKIRKIIVSTGSLQYSKSLAEKLIKKAKSELNKIKLKKQGKEFLLEIADYMVNRDF